MTQKQLEIFIAVAESLNFTKAARKLYLSQTTVTFQIKALEELLGVPLFVRNSRNVLLTPAGKIFYLSAKKILRSMEEAIVNAHEAARGYSGILSLGFASGVGNTIFSDIICDFIKAFPEIDVKYSSSYPGCLSKRMNDDIYDVVISPLVGTWETEEYEKYPVTAFSLSAAFHKNHRFAEIKKLKLSDFEGEKLIYVAPETEDLDFMQYFMTLLENNSIKVQIVARTDDIETISLMLNAQKAVTILPEPLVYRFYGETQLLTVPMSEEVERMQFWAIWKKENTNPALYNFVEYLKNQKDGCIR